jgi:hypothetical protein
MTAVIDGVATELRLDFARAHRRLAEARRRQRQKDTPERRSVVAECLTRVDAVLDMYLQTLAPQD